MVMIFSAKQQHESAYTKNEKANKAIVTYTGGIWTQLFLITLSWTFAILSFTHHDQPIIKLLHCFFTSLQGIFLFLSFFLFNDDVRRHYREKRRQKRRIQLTEIPYRAQSVVSSIGEGNSMPEDNEYKIVPIVNVESNEFNHNETKKIKINSIESLSTTPVAIPTTFFQQLLIKKRSEQHQQQKSRENYQEMKTLISGRKRYSKIDHETEQLNSLLIEKDINKDDDSYPKKNSQLSLLSSISRSRRYSNVNIVREKMMNDDEDLKENTRQEFRVTVV
ncbi:unnamed protein product [Didymodactylos carnosus]|uniref:Uncharacterized protein n=1 Tax=Didymodactylos carnosus TaxID=1234261 RepID=A0A8S2V2J8_9BILA|nr:unnamed protein product [Didymodactylos carnosus]